MKVKRVKGGNGKRWKKGHSCVTNPENNRFREEARGNFFQKLEGESRLTVEALAKHAEALSVGTTLHADPEDDRSIGRTFNTFATNFTTCTIPAFEKFFMNFTVDSELQTRMLAVHAAAQEYIQESNLPESSTSYMCALMSSLEGVKDSEDDVTATLSLLAKVIRKVSKDVLKAQFGEYSKMISEIFSEFSSTSNSKLIINIIGCLSVLLRAQDEIQWSYSSTLNLLLEIVSYVTHENAEIRMAAQYNASAVLKGSSFMNSGEKEEFDWQEHEMEIVEREEKGFLHKSTPLVHPSAISVGKFVITNLEVARRHENGKATLYLLIFLQQIINCLPENILEKCCARILGIMEVGDMVVNNRALKVLGALFYNKKNEISIVPLTQVTTEALISALMSNNDADDSFSLKLVPGINNGKLSITWMNVVASGIIYLTKLNEASGVERFCCFLEQLRAFWKSDDKDVHMEVWYVIDYLFDECIKPLKERISAYVSMLSDAFHKMEKCVSLQYEPAWPYIFRAIAPFFGVLSPYAPQELVSCLKSFAGMIETPDLNGKKQLELAIGAAINGMGPEEVMKIIPLQITGDIKKDEANLWILPILKKYVKNSSLCFYEAYFVHLASKCCIISDNLKSQGKKDSLYGKTYQIIERQIWSLLPCFADGAVDVERAFAIPSFAKLVCDNIKFREDIRLDVMAALRNLLASDIKSERLSFYGKNYVPALFNVYLLKPKDKYPKKPQETTVDQGQRLAAYATIETYLKVLPLSKTREFFKLILNRYDDEKTDMFTKRALFSLTRCFLPYLDRDSLSDVYLKAETIIKKRKAFLIKTAYRALEDLLGVDSDEGRMFVRDKVQDIHKVLTSKTFITANANASKLKCIMKLLAHMTADSPIHECDLFLRQIVEEAVQHCGRQSSTTARKSAFALLKEVGCTVQKIKKISNEETFQCCLELLPPLNPPSNLSANGVLALMVWFYKYFDMIPTHALAMATDNVSKLLLSEDRKIIRSSLGFIRMVFALYPTPVMSDLVDMVVINIISMPIDIRKKFRLKIRDISASLIRKFGADRVKALVPEEDPIRKMFTNIVKKDRRRKKTKKDDEDSEEEDVIEAPTSFDEILNEIDKQIENDDKGEVKTKAHLKVKRSEKKKKQTWIREDADEIIDFMDSKSSQHITTKKPKIKQLRFEEAAPQTDEEKYGFKIDKKTNKFIITDDFKEKDDSSDNEEMAFEDLPGVISHSKEDAKPNPPTKRKRRLSEDSDSLNKPATKYAAGGSVGEPFKMKKRFDYGSEFRAKKAGGDVSAKGGVAPYAYVQFSKDKLNKRKKAKYAGQFKSLVKGAKKGAIRGSKMKARKR